MRMISIGPHPMENNGVSDYMGQYHRAFRRLGYQIKIIKIYFLRNKWSQLKWIGLAAQSAAQKNRVYWVQHTPTISGPLILVFLGTARVTRKRVILVSHEPPEIYAKYLKGVFRRLYFFYEKKIADWSFEYVVHTSYHQKQMVAIGVRKDLKLIPLPLYRLEKVLIPPQRKYWGFYGQISPKKGLDLLLEALQNRPPGYFPKVLILGAPAPGNEEYVEELKRGIAPEYKSHVEFCGFISNEIKGLNLSSLSLVIYPYRWVSQSAALSETCFYRVPYLASNLPFFSEFQGRFGCGRLFTAESAEALLSEMELFRGGGIHITESQFVAMEGELSLECCAEKMTAVLHSESFRKE